MAMRVSWGWFQRAFSPYKSIGALCALVLVASAVIARPDAANAVGECATTTTGSYSVQLCLTAPLGGAALNGAAPVTLQATPTGTFPGIQRAQFTLNGAYLLTDVTAPYTFLLPTTKFVDGSYTLGATLLLRDTTVTAMASVAVTFVNGITTPPVNTNTFTPHTPAGPGVRVVAAGDAAGGRTEAAAVLDQVSAMNPSMYLYLGDVYEKGTATEFYNWYGNNGSLFHRFYNITNPIVGNHEYENGVAPGYFDYWDNVPSYYSYDAGGWHFIALNTEHDELLAPGGVQYNFLQQDLNANAAKPCTMVYFHHPRFSVGAQGDTPSLSAAWQLMASAGVDIALTGHDHNYQRWVPLDGNGTPSAGGITQFVAGAGGFGVQRFARTDSRLAVGLDLAPGDNGALSLDLGSSGAAYAYVDIDGDVRDSGTVACSGAGADTQAPTAPANLSATTVSSQAQLAWNAATDNVGVSGYRILRNGAELTTVSGSTLTHTDRGLQADTTFGYQVVALDAAGNASPPSNSASITTGPPPTSYTYTPLADAYVSGPSPTTNFGSASTLRTDLNDGQRSFIRFDTTGTLGTITNATLRVFAETTHSLGIDVGGVTGTWTENGVTFNNSPATTGPIGGSAPALAGNYLTVDVTSLVAQSASPTIDVVLLPRNDTGLRMSSRENATTPPQLVLTVTPPNGDTTPPDAPTLSGAVAYRRVDLNWSAASDNVGVTGYTLRRNGVNIATLGGATLAYADTNVTDSTAYTYVVTARDAAGNVSSESNLVTLTTPTPSSLVRPVIADTYIDGAAPNSAFGTATTLRVDGSPLQRSLLRFSTSGINGTITSATLRLHPISSLSAGVKVVPITGAWSETTTHATAPNIGANGVNSGGVVSGTPVDINVTSMVTTGGTVDLALLPLSNTAVRFSSREGAQPAELLMTFAPGGPDVTAPTAPGSLQATASTARIDLSWTASSDSVGVDHYVIQRGGVQIATPSGATLSHSDPGLAHATTYNYSVLAVDAAGNVSAAATASATTPPPPSVYTRVATADTYVDASSSTSSFGTQTSFRVDNNPQQRALVRFDTTGVTGTTSTVKLRIYGLSALSAGVSVSPITSPWSETTTNATAPTIVDTTSVVSGPVVTNTYLEIDVTTLVADQMSSGAVNLALLPRSSTSVRFSSRQGTQPPQLVIVTSG